MEENTIVQKINLSLLVFNSALWVGFYYFTFTPANEIYAAGLHTLNVIFFPAFVVISVVGLIFLLKKKMIIKNRIIFKLNLVSCLIAVALVVGFILLVVFATLSGFTPPTS